MRVGDIEMQVDSQDKMSWIYYESTRGYIYRRARDTIQYWGGDPKHWVDFHGNKDMTHFSGGGWNLATNPLRILIITGCHMDMS